MRRRLFILAMMGFARCAFGFIHHSHAAAELFGNAVMGNNPPDHDGGVAASHLRVER